MAWMDKTTVSVLGSGRVAVLRFFASQIAANPRPHWPLRQIKKKPAQGWLLRIGGVEFTTKLFAFGANEHWCGLLRACGCLSPREQLSASPTRANEALLKQALIWVAALKANFRIITPPASRSLSASVDSPHTTALRIRGATPKGISRVCTLFGHALDHRTAAARARRFHSHSRLRGLRARADDLRFF